MHRSRFFLALALLVPAVGCGGGDTGVIVDGTVTKNGSPITFGDSEGVMVTLTNGSEKHTVTVDEKGKFTIQKPAGGGIPAGKYTVSYTHFQNASPYSKAKPFKHEKKLPEEFDLSSANRTLTINIETKDK